MVDVPKRRRPSPRARIARPLGLRLALACTLIAGGGAMLADAAAAAPGRRKPLDPAAKMPALPPAMIDDTLVIGGKDIDARKIDTRMTVAVQVNGRGPFRFVVDSGADSS